MKTKRIILIAILCAAALVCAWPAAAANTVLVTGGIINISAMDGDFDLRQAYSSYVMGSDMRVISIKFYGGAVSDRLVIKNRSDAGAVFFDRVVDDLNYPPIEYYFGIGLDPVIDFSACTLSAGHKVILTLGQ